MLYTDEDDKLAKYVREHFASLDKLSGDWCKIFVLEKPPSEWKNAKAYWQSILKSELYEMWSMLRWITTKPFDKSEIYEISRKIGVEFEQLPCLVLFGQNHNTEKLVLPIEYPTTDYMRTMFSTLERILLGARRSQDGELSSQIAFSVLSSHFDEIIGYLNKVAEKHETPYGEKYIFEGNTVFINRPKGDLSLSDFQK